MWEWDEALFALAMKEYDVPSHHPHPPGYPLFILAAKAFRLVIHSDFRALQMVTLVAAMTLFPLAFALARELRLDFLTAYLGALLFVFFPSVWFFGGTAFSDIGGTALIFGACTLLLRGCRSPSAYVAGAFVLGLAGGFRPQALMAGLVPALIATWFQLRARQWKAILAGAAVGALVLIASYGGAALASSSVEGFVAISRSQSQYVREVDSYHNPGRPTLASLVQSFLIHAPRGPRRATWIICYLAMFGVIVALLRRRWGFLILLSIFGPLGIFSWLMLDPAAASRYGVAYVVLHALAATEGARVLASVFARWRPRLVSGVQAALVLVLILRFVIWTLPALAEVRRASAPTAAAMEWIVANLKPGESRIYVVEGLGPFSGYYIDHFRPIYIRDAGALPATFTSNAWLANADMLSKDPAARNFVRRRDRLIQLARDRYYEASVAPAVSAARFDDGWHEEESAEGSSWRWMGHRSRTLLGTLPGNGRLVLTLGAPIDSLPRAPQIEIFFNGALLERRTLTSPDTTLTFVVPSRPDALNEMILTTDLVANPKKQGTGDDARDLGLRLHGFSWGPVDAAAALR